jgi:hypothetical protein
MDIITMFGWVAAICLAAFVITFACTSVIEYSPLGAFLRPSLSRWFPNERFNRVTGKMMVLVFVMGWPLCGLAWLTGRSAFGYFWLATAGWLFVQRRFWS